MLEELLSVDHGAWIKDLTELKDEAGDVDGLVIKMGEKSFEMLLCI